MQVVAALRATAQIAKYFVYNTARRCDRQCPQRAYICCYTATHICAFAEEQKHLAMPSLFSTQPMPAGRWQMCTHVSTYSPTRPSPKLRETGPRWGRPSRLSHWGSACWPCTIPVCSTQYKQRAGVKISLQPFACYPTAWKTACRGSQGTCCTQSSHNWATVLLPAFPAEHRNSVHVQLTYWCQQLLSSTAWAAKHHREGVAVLHCTATPLL
jgi:hypothetical protein